MPVYHGTDEVSANGILSYGLDQLAWEAAASGAGPDPKGFSVTDSLEVAQDWARWRALDRLGDPERGVVFQADPNDLPLAAGQPGKWVDPGERFIRTEDFPLVGPSLFQVVR
jgi:hypothetical protein